MNIPARVWAHANPLARRTIAAMHPGGEESIAALDAEAMTLEEANPQPRAKPRLRYDMVAEAKRRQGENHENERATASNMSKKALRVDIVQNMREQVARQEAKF